MERDLMVAAGFTMVNGGRANDYYTRKMNNGQWAVAGNMNGPWGWDTYTTEADYMAGGGFETQSPDYETPEAMLAAMRALGLI